MATKEEILNELSAAEEHIAIAKQMVAGTGPEPPSDVVQVNPGMNLLQMIADNPENTVFNVHNDFVQDCGIETVFAKPCTLNSQYGRLIGIFYPKPNTHFLGMILDGGNSNTILTGADGVTLDGCTLNGNVNGQHRGILANAKGMRIRKTRILNIARDIDTQAILGTNGTDDLLVSGCELEASGENILFGGDTTTSEAAIPRNIVIENNIITKRIAWRAGTPTCKNLLELKQVDTISIRGNVMDFSFVDGQAGYGIVFTVRNEYGASPWANVKNVLFENNNINHVAGGFQILGRDDRGGAYPSQIMTNVVIRNNKIADMSNQWGGNGRCIFISGGPDKLTFEGNEFQCPTIPNSAITFDQPQYKVTNLTFVDQKLMIEGEYGIFGTSAPGLGKAAIDYYAPGYVWENNKVHKSGVNNIKWPAGTIFV